MLIGRIGGFSHKNRDREKGAKGGDSARLFRTGLAWSPLRLGIESVWKLALLCLREWGPGEVSQKQGEVVPYDWP